MYKSTQAVQAHAQAGRHACACVDPSGHKERAHMIYTICMHPCTHVCVLTLAHSYTQRCVQESGTLFDARRDVSKGSLSMKVS